MKKTISLVLCIVCVLVFSAFDWGWGKKAKSQKEATANAGTTWQTPPAEKVVPTKVVSKTKSNLPTQAVSKTKSSSPAQVSNSASVNDKATAISTLAKIVGSGTPDERKARIESLKRVSQALAQSQAQNQTKNTR